MKDRKRTNLSLVKEAASVRKQPKVDQVLKLDFSKEPALLASIKAFAEYGASSEESFIRALVTVALPCYADSWEDNNERCARLDDAVKTEEARTDLDRDLYG
jgi:hypothetical protein